MTTQNTNVINIFEDDDIDYQQNYQNNIGKTEEE